MEIQNAKDIFNSELLNISDPVSSQSVSKEDMVMEIESKLQDILIERFPGNPQKQKIKKYPDRLNFAGPCCGDSAYNNTKKRGNIILSGPFQMTYKCHNCGTSMPVQAFFKRFRHPLSLNGIDYVTQHRPDASAGPVRDSSMNYLYDISSIEKLAVSRDNFKAAFSLEECNIPNIAYYYLINRKQYNFDKFLYQPRYQLLFLLNLTPAGNIIGIQVAHLNKDYKGPKYKTYKLSRIYKELLKVDMEIPDDVDFLSMIFNILLINYNKPVTVVEGPMDSFLIKNSIATCGAGKHINPDFPIRYMFDDDVTGRKHAIEKLNDGFPVFMWDKFKSDVHLPYKQKWDMNDVVKYCSDNKIQIPKLDLYFSNNELDSLDI